MRVVECFVVILQLARLGSVTAASGDHLHYSTVAVARASELYFYIVQLSIIMAIVEQIE